jgi:putative hydrolase of the HAD superfamily
VSGEPTADPKAAAALPRRSGSLVVVAVGGGVASGKTTVAKRLAPVLHAVHVGSDDVRGEMSERGLAAFSRPVEDRVYAEMLRRADQALARGRSVVLDGCYVLAREREDARAAAVRHGASFLFLECRASEAALRERLAARDAKLGADVVFWQEIHDDVARRSEPVMELLPDEHDVLRTDEPTEKRLAEVAARVRARRGCLAMPAAVTFDCWNTLIYEGDWHRAHAIRVARLQEAAREAGQPVAPEVARRAFDAAWSRHMDLWSSGEVSGAREVARWGLAELGLAEPHPALEHLIATFEEASHTGGVRTVDGARETLDALAAAGIPCALVCDTGLTPGRVVRHHLDRLGLLDGLAVQIFSDEVGVPKPDPKAFRAALEPLGVRPEHALHVGDLRRTDVAGARSLGMRSVRIRDRHDDTSPLPDADFVVSSHADLRALFDR